MIYITLHSIKYRWRARRIRVLLDYTEKLLIIQIIELRHMDFS